MWYYIYRTDSGRLASETSFDPLPLPAGFAYLAREERANLAVVMWDEATRDFVARPVPVIVDRLQDLISDVGYVDFKTAWNGLTATNKTKLAGALTRLLGPRRYRQSDEAIELEG